MNRILLLEDHKRLALLISKGLAPAGIVVDSFERIDHAWQALQQVPYQAMVLTARNALHDRVNGLDAGADDYLSKPFAMEEMVARVKALLRRPAERQSLEPGYGDLVLQPSSNLIWCADKSQLLSQAEMQVLFVLMRKPGETVRHNLLEAAAWGLSEAVTPNALDVVLHRIRKKLLAIGSRCQIINARGVGYALAEPKIP